MTKLGGLNMKITVGQEACIGCGMCIDICPKAFKYNSEDKSEAISSEVDESIKDKVLEAKSVCPVDAIEAE